MEEDRKPGNNPWVGTLSHRIVMFLLSLACLLILIRVIIVAAPGYDFHTWFDKSEVLTKADSLIIRIASFICVVPLVFLTPAFFISIGNDAFSKKLYSFFKDIEPVVDKIDDML